MLATCVLKLRQLLISSLNLFSDYPLSRPGKQSPNKGSYNIYISSGLTVSLKLLFSIQLYWLVSLDKYFHIFISSTFGQYLSVQFAFKKCNILACLQHVMNFTICSWMNGSWNVYYILYIDRSLLFKLVDYISIKGGHHTEVDGT